jgi:hypothetical protein
MRIGWRDKFPIAKQVIVSAYSDAEEYDGEREEGYSYEEDSAETTDLKSRIS